MAISITPSPFGSVTVTLDGELGGVLSVSVLATSNSALDMAIGTPGPAGATGSQGPAGANGAPGVGVPVGGTSGQALVKLSGTNYDTGWATITSGGGTWGSITGTLSSQTDLWNNFNTYIPITSQDYRPIYREVIAEEGGTMGDFRIGAFNNNTEDGFYLSLSNGGGESTEYIQLVSKYHDAYIQFKDDTIQRTAGLPLTGGTVTGDLTLSTSEKNINLTDGAGLIYHDGPNAATLTFSDGLQYQSNALVNNSVWIYSFINFTDSNGYTELNATGITFPDSSVQTTAYDPAVLNGYLPLTGGTMSGNLVISDNGYLNSTITPSQISILDENSANYSSLKDGVLIFHNDSGGADSAYFGSNGFNIGNGLLVGTNFGITFPDATTQTTAFPGYTGTISQYIRGDGSLNTFPTIPVFPPTGGTTSQYIRGDGSVATYGPLGDRYLTSSTSTLTCDSGNGKTMTVGTGLSYSRQQDITVSYNTANHMHGTVLTYDSVTGVMTFDSNTHSGGGTYSNWEVNVGGVAGAVLPVGGTSGQVLAKINSTNFNTEWKTLGTMSTEPASAYLSTASAVANYQTISGMSAYLSTASAVANYLTISSASSTYQTQSGMSSYLSTASAVANYLTISSASSTYQTQAGMSAYLSTSAASSTYQTQSGMSAYLSTSAAASTYQTQSGMSAYLSTASAVANYQTLSGMSAYLSTASASANFIGTSAYATTAQAQSGTSTTTVVSPATMLDAKYFQGGKSMVQIAWSTSVSGAGASAGAQNANARLNVAPTTATGYAIASAVIANNSRGQVFNSGFDFSKRVQFGVRVARNVASPDSNSVFRFSIGKISATDASDLSARGLMIKVSGSGALQLLVHNGTALTTTTSSFSPVNSQAYDVIVTSDGAGNCALFVNGSSVATSSGGPTTSGVANAGYLMFEVQNTATISASPQNICVSDYHVQVNS